MYPISASQVALCQLLLRDVLKMQACAAYAFDDGKKTSSATRLLELVAKNKIAGAECNNASNLYPE